MARMQFFKDRLYHFAGKRFHPQSGRTEAYEIIIVGELVRTYLDPFERVRDCKGEFVATDRVYRLDDGHLPDCQPRASGHELRDLMGAQKIRFAHPVEG